MLHIHVEHSATCTHYWWIQQYEIKCHIEFAVQFYLQYRLNDIVTTLLAWWDSNGSRDSTISIQDFPIPGIIIPIHNLQKNLKVVVSTCNFRVAVRCILLFLCWLVLYVISALQTLWWDYYDSSYGSRNFWQEFKTLLLKMMYYSIFMLWEESHAHWLIRRLLFISY